MVYIFTLAMLILIAFGARALWDYKRASPVFWQLMSFSLIALGTAPLLDFNLESDRVYAICLFIAFAAFLIPSVLWSQSNNFRSVFSAYQRKAARKETGAEIRIIELALLFSIIASVIYYYLIGYNIVILLISGQLIDYSSARLETYSGDNYFAPGYVNQFKNILMPSCSAILVFRMLETGARKRAYALGTFLVVINSILILGTGQRGYIVYTIGGILFGYFLYSQPQLSPLKFRKVAFMMAPPSLIFIFMTTFYQGGEGATFLDILAVTLSRFTTIQQEGGLVAFRYIYDLPPAWFAEWGRGLVGILPGQEGSNLAHEVHGVMYGTTRGTVPISTVGSAYYNGSFIGILILFPSIALAYSALYTRYLKGHRSISRAIIYGFLFFYLAIFVTDSPIILIDNGVVTLLIFLTILRVARAASPDRAHQSKEFLPKVRGAAL